MIAPPPRWPGSGTSWGPDRRQGAGWRAACDAPGHLVSLRQDADSLGWAPCTAWPEKDEMDQPQVLRVLCSKVQGSSVPKTLCSQGPGIVLGLRYHDREHRALGTYSRYAPWWDAFKIYGKLLVHQKHNHFLSDIDSLVSGRYLINSNQFNSNWEKNK